MFVGVHEACTNGSWHLHISFLKRKIGDGINWLWCFSLSIVIVSFQQIFFIALIAFLHRSVNAQIERSVFVQLNGILSSCIQKQASKAGGRSIMRFVIIERV